MRSQADVSFCRTPVAARVIAALSQAQERRWIVSIQGPPGVGKTTAAIRYADENASRVWYYAARPDTAAKGPLFRELAMQFAGVKDVQTRENVRSLRLAAEWALYGTSSILLILDEAQNLNPDTLETLRAIFDEGVLALAFLGNHTFTDRFKHERGSLTASPQFLSRIDLTVSLDSVNRDDVAVLAGSLGIPDSLLDRLAKVAGGVKGLRFVARVAEVARDLASGRQAVRADFEEAIETLVS